MNIDLDHCRILAVDDEPKLRQLYGEILSGEHNFSAELEQLESLGSGSQTNASSGGNYDLTVADQGERAVELAKQALEEERPYSIAFIDMRMPPGIGGLETAKRLRKIDSRIYIVFVTAYADHTIDEIDTALEYDTLYVRKPFIREEILQMARSLGRSWNKDRRLEQSVLRSEVDAIYKSLKAKDDFLASMSHELRTPLTTIIGNSEFLAESALDEDQQGLLRSIEISSLGLLALINDILDLSKIASGKFTIDQVPYDLDEVLEEVGYIFAARAFEAGLYFHVEKEQPFPRLLIGDGRRLGEVLINLLSNAMKFTEEGRVVLRVRVDEPAAELHLSVEDEGIGMTEEVLTRLFQPFVQADATISGRFGGTGLGLHISWTLAELMGGEIDVESETGKGAIFRLTLPYRESDQLASTSRRKHCFVHLDCYFEGRVLVAEDTPELQQLERRILQAMGLTVVFVNNGKEAVERALSERFDVVLMDMEMPEMDGVAATEMLRQLDYPVPIIALTANVMQTHRDRFEAAGCSGFLAKPIDRHRLQEMLSQYLPPCERKPGSLSSTMADQRPSAEETEVDSLIDDEMRQLFTERTAVLKQALEQAAEVADWDLVREHAHTVKGSGTSFGHPELTALAHETCDAVDHGRLGVVLEMVTELIGKMEHILAAEK